MHRKTTKPVSVGPVTIGGGAPIVVQSMTNTDTRDVGATLAQINALADAGCEVVRLAVLDDEAASALKEIAAKSPLPVIADIHFDYRLAIRAVEQGIHGLRLNPGNIGARWKVQEVVRAVKERQIPIRIGVNAGSLEKELLEKYGGPTAGGMIESALGHIRLLEEEGYHKIKVSLKASSVPLMLEAYRKIYEVVDYPLHLGVTEAGTVRSGVVKSAIGIGTLLAEGIGDTIRVSLTGDPVREIPVALEILHVLGLRQRSVELISCPTCGRTQVDLALLAESVEEQLAHLPVLDKPLKVAVMGCAVNGPGEAREADFGIAGGKGTGLLFRKGEIVARLPENELLPALLREIEEYVREHAKK
ncbi:flavodoxin-dependent (E)-4-hydroxy-3-methylbut-2-enyl-diphosphate synthase [Desulfosporosinus fructosivorans]|uniref:4-hydroxy-3-methylbut-2-en-1-yl diphosphate synthase (flavodoxin) n=1 Tax=Desulfosporosinus fructosivorans TaxID=2018669 RepID=A0A4Z0QX10_9FIRM|nr:flavodoxin-dependent (E)-4-hydroxy-3-methylbut-2-enyl-diphosphate synthase [Desulfosporosinus fructosivorans]TGE35341.1 flavodoxin-dependent (E)-4-hydroxy-3-methylbut-2-enyl-diphosphate synthase [Desulfosporosinus fructosivorans]